MVTPIMSTLSGQTAGRSAAEVVERKGIGHPDTICDALAEEVSRRLCEYYLRRFGFILHHNVDKVLLSGGSAQSRFGGGSVLEPMEIFFSGRATRQFKGEEIPVDALAREACSCWLDARLHALDATRHARLHCLIKPGSADLIDLYLRQERTGTALANDSSCGVGYAPLDELETLAIELEQGLNAAAFKSEHPEYGEDVKIMAVRQGDRIELTLACAFVDRYVSGLDDYLAKKHVLAEHALAMIRTVTNKAVVLHVNEADDVDTGSVYLTVTGTSAEAGDDGETGRGNRGNGLITPYRPMNLEAAAGKNPVTHVGKLYSLVAQRIADHAVKELPEVTELYCCLVSRIGQPVREPQLIDLRVGLEQDTDLHLVRPRLSEIVDAELGSLDRIRQELLSGTLLVY